MKLSVVFCCLALLSESAHATRRGPGIPSGGLPPEMVEIDFEPMGPDDGPAMMMGRDGPPEMLVEGPSSTRGAAKSRSLGPQTGLSEKELDDVLSDMLGKPSKAAKDAPSDLPPGIPAELASAIPGGIPDGAEVVLGDGPDGAEIVEIDGPPPEMMMAGPPGGIPDDMRSSIPMSALKQLFPPGQVIIEEDDGPNAPPDAVVQDMMREMSEEFQQQLLPLAQQAAADDALPNSCGKELKTFCKGAKSRLHCLGQHSQDVSDTCRTDVGKSVPFLCSGPIDKYCDVLMGGILSCLGNRLKDLDGPCRDAVTTTKHVINKINTQKSSVTNPKTGQKHSVVPKTKASLSQREANLDAKLIGLAQDSSTSTHEEKVPASMPARLLGQHDNAHLAPTQISPKRKTQASPPFAAVFVPFSLLVASAAAIAYFRPVIAAKLMQQETAKPLTVGTELTNPTATSIPMSYPGRLPCRQ